MTSTDESSEAIAAPRLGEDPELSSEWTWPQFRLRTLFILILVICMPLAYWGLQLMRTRVQEDIVRELAISGAKAGWFDGDVTQVTFRGGSFKKSSLARLAELPKLRRVVMIDTGVTVETLDGMAALDLVELRIRRAKQLSLPNDDAASPTRPSSASNDSSGGGRQALVADAPLVNEQPRSAAPIAIRWCRELRTLGLEDTDLDNRIVDTLLPLDHLESLSLSGSPVDDDCIDSLARLTTLQKLFLQRTKFTESGVERLRRELPKAVIIWTP